MSETIATIDYPGSAENVRAFIERFLIPLQSNSWKSPNGEMFFVFYEHTLHAPKRDIWIVRYVEPTDKTNTKCAAIYASESLPNETRIQFIDGVMFFPDNHRPNEDIIGRDVIRAERDPIGNSFVILANEIKHELEGQIVKREDAARELPKEPKTDSTTLQEIKAEGQREPIPPIEYPGSAGNFSAWMEDFLARRGEIFSISKLDQVNAYRIDYTKIAQTQTREAWHIKSLVPVIDGKKTQAERHGMILALEALHQKTTIRFMDGRYYGDKNIGARMYSLRGGDPNNLSEIPEVKRAIPIGDDLAKLAEIIRAELEQISTDKRGVAIPLWERIPNKGWYRKALKFWHEGLTVPQIAERIGKSEQTIYNRFAELRGQYGEEIVPKRR